MQRVGRSSYQHITPVAKSSTIDIRNPLQSRGITLASAAKKLFSFVLNQRLTKWAEMNNILSDSPNGFRKGRSTVEHLKSVTSIIETRKSARHSNIDVWMVNY